MKLEFPDSYEVLSAFVKKCNFFDLIVIEEFRNSSHETFFREVFKTIIVNQSFDKVLADLPDLESANLPDLEFADLPDLPDLPVSEFGDLPDSELSSLNTNATNLFPAKLPDLELANLQDFFP